MGIEGSCAASIEPLRISGLKTTSDAACRNSGSFKFSRGEAQKTGICMRM